MTYDAIDTLVNMVYDDNSRYPAIVDSLPFADQLWTAIGYGHDGIDDDVRQVFVDNGYSADALAELL